MVLDNLLIWVDTFFITSFITTAVVGDNRQSIVSILNALLWLEFECCQHLLQYLPRSWLKTMLPASSLWSWLLVELWSSLEATSLKSRRATLLNPSCWPPPPPEIQWDTISGYEDQQDDLDHIKDHNDGNNLPSVCSRHLTGYKARDYRAAGTVTRSPIRVRALSRKDLIYLAN